MSDKFVLVVSDEKDGKHGEISVLDAAHKIERLVETLLERKPEDILKEAQSVLKNRRWDAREGPFRGFGSPPGRF